jgi:hypothetical protein
MECPMCKGNRSCPECDGIGDLVCDACGSKGGDCEQCKGLGHCVCRPCDGSGACPLCNGEGKIAPSVTS